MVRDPQRIPGHLLAASEQVTDAVPIFPQLEIDGLPLPWNPVGRALPGLLGSQWPSPQQQVYDLGPLFNSRDLHSER